MYYCFRIPPFGAAHIKAVKKEQKLYLWDWSLVEDSGPRFENMTACHLLKYCHFQEDTLGCHMELRYLRDTTGREVDFVVIKDGKPQFAVECQCSAKGISPSLYYFKERTKIPQFYQVHLESTDIERNGLRNIPFATLCQKLSLP